MQPATIIMMPVVHTVTAMVAETVVRMAAVVVAVITEASFCRSAPVLGRSNVVVQGIFK